MNSIEYQEILKETITGLYPGKVVCTEDPKKLGRVRVRVYGIYDDPIPEDVLPWAEPLTSSPVLKGSEVWVMFDGDHMMPRYFPSVGVSHKQRAQFREEAESSLSDSGSSVSLFGNSPSIVKTGPGYDVIDINPDSGVYVHLFACGSHDTVDTGTRTIKTIKALALDSQSIEISGSTSITIKSGSAEVVINSEGEVEIKGAKITINGSVAPNASGGPFCALTNCLFTGAPHQGNIVTGS